MICPWFFGTGYDFKIENFSLIIRSMTDFLVDGDEFTFQML